MAYTPPMSFTTPGSGYTPVYGNAPIATPTLSFDKPSPAPVTTVSYNPPTGPVGNAPIISPTFPTLKPPTGKPSAGNLTFSFGGGGGGSSAPSAPSNVLTPQTFAPYESTYVPPTPATPVPYDYATADPYVYGQGLSNAGAAYNIWGSKPGENPYLLSTPADYTPGLIGLDPVTLPNNMPNKAADISAFTPTTKTRTPEQIVRDYGYTGRTAPMQTNVPPSMRDSAPNAQVMLDAAAANVRNGRYNNMQEAMNAQQAYNLKYPTLTPAENKAQIAKSQEMMNKRFTKPVEAKPTTPRTSIKPVAGTGAKGPAGGASYAASKSRASKALSSYTPKTTTPAKSYSTKDVNNSFSARRDVRNLFA